MGFSKASLRGLSIHERIAKMAEANKPATVRVYPTNDVVRSILTHPHAGGFPAEGPAVWPDDGFTLRRIQDGDVTVEGEAAGESRGG